MISGAVMRLYQLYISADLKAVFMAVKLNVSLDADLSDPDVYEAHKDMMETTVSTYKY